MKCQFCGRENEDGKTFCECGRPLTYGTDAAVAGQSFEDQLKSQTLDSVKVKKSVSFTQLLPVIVIVLAAIAAGVFFLMGYITEKNILKPETWETVKKGNYSISLPKAMKEAELLELNSSFENIGFFTSDKVAVYIAMNVYNGSQKEMYGDKDIKQLVLDSPVKRTVNGVELVPQIREGQDYIFVEYPTSHKNYIKESDELWTIIGTYFTENAMYEVSTFCAESEKDTYRDVMFEMIDSFKLE
ncbi:MAG: zinc ribbon domain-containing protein [Ruminococcus sp.]|nr:zinc ribbon domain-containing protein [Ruminococcus sp.]